MEYHEELYWSGFKQDPYARKYEDKWIVQLGLDERVDVFLCDFVRGQVVNMMIKGS